MWAPRKRDKLWEHVGVGNWQPGVWVDRESMIYVEERLLVSVKRFDLGHGDLLLLDELFRTKCRGGRTGDLCWTDRLASARICWHWWVCSLALVSGASSLDIQG